jgi:indolepyruvate ferredoxin oxidoreductase beta subunit
LRNYEAVMAALDAAGTAMAPATLRELRDAALADEHGDKLRATLARVAAPTATTPTGARRETPVGIS